MNKIKEILDYIESLFPNAKCELNYNKDYELLIAIVLSAQATDVSVNKVTPVLFNKYKTLKELNNANLKDLEQIIRQIGTYKKKSIFIKEIANKLLNDYNGKVPNNKKNLESLPGVGRKTANVFLAEYYNIPKIAVDTHVERVSKRLNIVPSTAKILEIEEILMRKIPKERWIKTHHQLIFFGRYQCKAIKPNCSSCKLKNICNYYNKQKK